MIDFYPKGWGCEVWIANTPLYCGKILKFKAGKKCSYHYHRLKSETFYNAKGLIIVRYGYEEDIEKAETIILKEGEKFDVPVGMIHQMEAIEDTDLFEFSTEHFESDSYRIIKGD
jgi:quercetin dioxygenase-like cupin family protein